MTEQNQNYFSNLVKIDVGEHIEKKGHFNYLSWPFAVQQLGQIHPTATWDIVRFPLMDNPEIRVPYMQTPLGYFVEVAVTIDGVTKSQVHPVLNNYNKPIEKPSTFDINTSIQRALVKAIALHGLGLYIFAGEDLPTTADKFTTAQQDEFYQALGSEHPIALTSLEQDEKFPFGYILEAHLEEHRESRTKTKEQKRVLDMVQAGHDQAQDYANSLTEAADSGDVGAVDELAAELTEGEKKVVWAKLPAEVRHTLKSMTQKEAA